MELYKTSADRSISVSINEDEEFPSSNPFIPIYHFSKSSGRKTIEAASEFLADRSFRRFINDGGYGQDGFRLLPTSVYYRLSNSSEKDTIGNYEALEYFCSPVRGVGYRFKDPISKENCYLNIDTGSIQDDFGNILAMLCLENVPAEYILYDQLLDFVKHDKMVLFVATEFTREKYKNIYKRFQKDFIQEAYDKDVKVVVMPSLEIDRAVYPGVLTGVTNKETYLENITLVGATFDCIQS